MKQQFLNSLKTLNFFFISMLFSIVSFAQDKKVDINLNTKSGSDNMFAQPWVWIIGGAVFILLLVALLRNKNNS